MANNNANDKWYFTKEQLDVTPSRKCGYDSMKELSHRQQTANFIQDMGQRLKVSQLCINTAIVYMHRFYVFHSFTNFPWHQMAAAALFLAAKVEEQPRKLEYVIRCANICRNSKDMNIDVNSERYQTQSQDLVFNENVLLQTLGFDVAIDHPHTHVVRCCHLVRASKDLAQSSYFLASNSLHLTTMCLQYKPTVVACFCIHLACKWSRWEIPLSTEKKEWFLYVDPTVTAELLKQLTDEFLHIFETCPSRLKEKIMAIGDNGIHNTSGAITNSPFDTDPKKIPGSDQKDPHSHRSQHDSKSGSENDLHKHRSSRPHESTSSSQQQREREYREKKEREKLAQQQQQQQQHAMKTLPPGSQSSSSSTNSKQISHGHHRPSSMDPKMKPHSRQLTVGGSNSSSGGGYSSNRAEPRDILREAAKDSPFGIATKDFRDPSSTREQHNNKDPFIRDQVRGSDKDVQKRDYLLKPNVTDTNSLNNYANYNKQNSDNNKQQRIDPNRMKSVDPNKILVKSHPKTETDIKRHLSATSHDKNSVYLNKSTNSTTSQKIKSPFTADTSKSVPKPNINNTQQQIGSIKQHHHNGSNSSNNSYILPVLDNDIKIKQEIYIKEEITTPAIVKRPSLFSPEKTPPHKKYNSSSIKMSPSSFKQSTDLSSSSSSDMILSPLLSPDISNKRVRNYSTGSEPELRPVMKKIDQVEGFENLMRDSTIGINKLHQVPDIITPIADKEKTVNDVAPNYSKEMKPPDIIPPMSCDNTIISQPIVNGIETNPTLISNLLKETPTVPHLPVIATSAIPPTTTTITITSNIQHNMETQLKTQIDVKEKDKEHHHKSKKKNKEKHKHKDKDKNREEKKKKHKDKDKEKHKHKDRHEVTIIEPPTVTAPIKLKIQKDKIQSMSEQNVPLKIKIPKDVIKTETIEDTTRLVGSIPPTIGGLKIKIPKDKISNCNSGDMIGTTTSSSSSSSSSSKKRDRSSPGDVPPAKVSRSSHRDSKQNGRHSYNKVTQLGDGDTSIHRLAESKYINKNSSS